jgi:hypothetical protein
MITNIVRATTKIYTLNQQTHIQNQILGQQNTLNLQIQTLQL